MYVNDFFRSIIRKKNYTAIVYLMMNVALISMFIYLFLPGPYTAGMSEEWTDAYRCGYSILCGIVVYTVSVAIALSPLGESILRFQHKCHPVEREDYKRRILPLFNEVYAGAKREDPSIADGVELYMSEMDGSNAYAMGRKTICITRGLLNEREDVIKAVLAHEFGHLSNKDTDLILVISIGNFVITGAMIFVRLVLIIIGILLALFSALIGGSEGKFGVVIGSLMALVSTGIMTAMMWIWTKLGLLLVAQTGRECEFEADAFARRLGYGFGLCLYLDSGKESSPEGIFAALSSMCPISDERIARLIAQGVRYSRY